MPEHLKALIVILVLATALFAFARIPACAVAINPADFSRRRNLWFGVTVAAFLAHNFWVYIVAAAVMLLLAAQREPNKLAMYFLLLFAVPAIPAQITGLGVIQHFFTIDYVRLLALALLFPAFLHLRNQPGTEPFGRALPDKLLAGYVMGVSSSASLATGGPETIYLANANTAVSPIPEPETYAMMLAGLGLLGFMARRRGKKLA